MLQRGSLVAGNTPVIVCRFLCWPLPVDIPLHTGKRESYRRYRPWCFPKVYRPAWDPLKRFAGIDPLKHRPADQRTGLELPAWDASA